MVRFYLHHFQSNSTAQFELSCTFNEVAKKLEFPYLYALVDGNYNDKVLNDGCPLNSNRQGGNISGEVQSLNGILCKLSNSATTSVGMEEGGGEQESSLGNSCALVLTTYRQDEDVMFEKNKKKEPYYDFVKALKVAMYHGLYAWTIDEKFVKDFLREYAMKNRIRFFDRDQEKGFPVLHNHMEKRFVKKVYNCMKEVLSVPESEKNGAMKELDCSFVKTLPVDEGIWFHIDGGWNHTTQFKPSSTVDEVAKAFNVKHVYALDEDMMVLNEGKPLNATRGDGKVLCLSNFPTAKVLLFYEEGKDVVIKNGTNEGRFHKACEAKLPGYNSCGNKTQFIKSLLMDYAHTNAVRFFKHHKDDNNPENSYPILYGHSDSESDQDFVKKIGQKFRGIRRRKTNGGKKRSASAREIDPKRKAEPKKQQK